MNVPVLLLVKVTVPVGVMPVPMSVSLTRAVHTVEEPKLIEAGAQLIMVVEVALLLTVSVVWPRLDV